MGLFDTLFGKLQAAGNTEADPAPIQLTACETSLRGDLEAHNALGEPASDARLRFHLLWTGTVQGVGFRWTNQNIAREHNVTGWARNLDDGSVEMEFEGTAAQLLRHLEALHKTYNRRGYRVVLDSAKSMECDPSEESFKVVY